MIVRPYQGLFAVAKNTNAWNGGAVAVGAGDAIEPNDPGILISPSRSYEADESLHGSAGRLAFDPDLQEPDFQFEANARYDGAINRLIAGVFGADARSDITETAKVGDKHLITMADTLDGVFWTLAMDWKVAFEEIDSFKPSQWQFTYNNKRATHRFSCMGRDWANSGTVNTGAQLGAITVPTPRRNLLRSQLKIEINAQTGGAFAASDVVPATNAVVTVDRQLRGIVPPGADVRNELRVGKSGWIGSLQVTDPEWQTTRFQDWHESGAKLKAQITFTGPNLPTSDGTNQFLFQVRIPQLQVTDYQPQGGETRGEQYTCEMSVAESAVAEMPDSVAPHVIVQNEDATEYDA